MEDDKDVELGVVVETPEESDQQTDDSPEAAIAELRAQIARFESQQKETQSQLEQERDARNRESRAREEAERRARQGQTDASEGYRRAREAEHDAIVNALANAQSQMAQAKAAYKQAWIDQDPDKAAELSGVIGDAAARIRQLEDGRAEIEARNARPVPQQQAPDEAGRREAFMNTLPPRSAAWIRDNYERYWGSNQFQSMVAGAHQLAVGRGIQPESDAYFRFIEEQTGLRSQEPAAAPRQPEVVAETRTEPTTPAVAPVSKAAQTTQRRSPTPSAPTTPSTPATPSRTPGRVQLSKDEMEFCRTNDIAPEAYAKNKAELIEEGRIGNPNALH